MIDVGNANMIVPIWAAGMSYFMKNIKSKKEDPFPFSEIHLKATRSHQSENLCKQMSRE